jgi:hypothetical protein
MLSIVLLVSFSLSLKAEATIQVYRSSKVEKRMIIMFMKHFGKLYRKVRGMVESDDSNAMEKGIFYLESENLCIGIQQDIIPL